MTTGLAFVSGEITTSAWVDVPSIVRETITDVGYTDARFGLDGETCGVMTAIQEQSPDIARGVDDALEHRAEQSGDPLDHLGAGDQGMMFGFACRETDELMPLPIAMAHRLSRRLADVRKAGVVPYLRPDGKSQVSIEYRDGRPLRVDTVLISAQHREEVDVETLLKPDIEAEVIDPVLREFPDLDGSGVRVLVNPTGRFEIGGPKADTGLTGSARSSSTRTAATHRTVVALSAARIRRRSTVLPRTWRDSSRRTSSRPGLADRAQLQLAYAIGTAHPVSLLLDTFGTEQADPERAPRSAVGRLRLPARRRSSASSIWRGPIYRETAAYGHFGRKEFPWEGTDRVDDLRVRRRLRRAPRSPVRSPSASTGRC